MRLTRYIHLNPVRTRAFADTPMEQQRDVLDNYRLCCRLSDATQRDVAKVFGYRDASSVGKRRQALAVRLAEDPALSRQVARLEKRLGALNS